MITTDNSPSKKAENQTPYKEVPPFTVDLDNTAAWKETPPLSDIDPELYADPKKRRMLINRIIHAITGR